MSWWNPEVGSSRTDYHRRQKTTPVLHHQLFLCWKCNSSCATRALRTLWALHGLPLPVTPNWVSCVIRWHIWQRLSYCFRSNSVCHIPFQMTAWLTSLVSRHAGQMGATSRLKGLFDRQKEIISCPPCQWNCMQLQWPVYHRKHSRLCLSLFSPRRLNNDRKLMRGLRKPRLSSWWWGPYQIDIGYNDKMPSLWLLRPSNHSPPQRGSSLTCSQAHPFLDHCTRSIFESNHKMIFCHSFPASKI